MSRQKMTSLSIFSLKGYHWSKFEFHFTNQSWDFLEVGGCGVHISGRASYSKNHVCKKGFDLIFTKNSFMHRVVSYYLFYFRTPLGKCVERVRINDKGIDSSIASGKSQSANSKI